MTSEAFFENLQSQYASQLPFVAYRKPNDIEVKALCQKNDVLHEVHDYDESGFVFAPFDTSQKPILIPASQSRGFKGEVVIPKRNGTSPYEFENLDRQKQFHINLITKAVSAISDGKLKKVVLSRCESLQLSELNPLALFQKLLHKYTSAFVYLWYHPQVGIWLGATPETLIHLRGQYLNTMALAGTQPFKEKTDVVWTEKEIEEQQLVTDFIVENLKFSVDNLQVSKPETVKAGNLLHLKTNIKGQLKSDALNLKHLLTSLHPTPAVCGLPRDAAKTFILENENYNREFYTGFLGELNVIETTTRNTNRRNVENNAYGVSKRGTNLYVNLRCMQLIKDAVLIYVGGGITKDSVPEAEWEETVHKSQIMKNVLR